MGESASTKREWEHPVLTVLGDLEVLTANEMGLGADGISTGLNVSGV